MDEYFPLTSRRLYNVWNISVSKSSLVSRSYVLKGRTSAVSNLADGDLSNYFFSSTLAYVKYQSVEVWVLFKFRKELVNRDVLPVHRILSFKVLVRLSYIVAFEYFILLFFFQLVEELQTFFHHIYGATVETVTHISAPDAEVLVRRLI